SNRPAIETDHQRTPQHSQPRRSSEAPPMERVDLAQVSVHRGAGGFLDIMLPATGLKIIGCTFHEKGNSRWVSLPGRPYQENGESKCANILDIPDKEARTAFQKAAQGVFLIVLEVKHTHLNRGGPNSV